MRYRLRTLLIALALGPPAAGLTWMVATGMRVHPVLLGAGIYAFLVLVLIGASWGLERVEKSRLARAIPWRTRPKAPPTSSSAATARELVWIFSTRN
jgi:predicted lysophospholipase L1 biosynthesis ABC-type transport system permease subunit